MLVFLFRDLIVSLEIQPAFRWLNGSVWEAVVLWCNKIHIVAEGSDLEADCPCWVLAPPLWPGFVVVVQSASWFQLFATPWTAARQASLSFTISGSLLRFMSVESVMLSNHLILCCLLLLLPSIFPSIRVLSNESALHIRWTKYWSFSFSNSPSNEYSGLISFRIDWFEQDL